MNDSRWSYDTIAEVYATDMGQSMPFDDVGYYLRLARASGGPVLELGCGTGRILLELLAANIDAMGADRSWPMLERLRRDARQRGLSEPRVAQMDLRAPALRGSFALILAPYSLITYLTDADDVDRFVAAARQLLRDDGRLVVDAFVPKDVTPFDDFRRDYRRPHGAGFLEREKRIACLADGTNRIERRYRLLDTVGAPLGEWTTVDRIRPYGAASLAALVTGHGLRLLETSDDYGQHDPAAGKAAQFTTLVFGR